MSKRKLSRWYYRYPGNFYALGPTLGRYGSQKEVREMVRLIDHKIKYGKDHIYYKMEKLPAGMEFWRAD